MKLQLRTLPIGPQALALALLVLLAVIGLAANAVWTMEHQGHIASGMNNQIVWGVPHVFAVFLIVAASGALNVASMSSALGRTVYKPLAPLSALLAIALLAGGLVILVSDLGRPERILVPLMHFNVRSIFAWNVILYSGFVGLVVAYLWTMLEWRAHGWTARVGLLAFLWRVLLTTGTGSIFGFLIGRQAFGSALLGPLFVLYSLAYGMAVFLLVLLAIGRWTGQSIDAPMLQRLCRLTGYFVIAALYGVAALHVTHLYFARQYEVERFLLLNGGIYTQVFWWGQVLLGGLVPMFLLLWSGASSPARVALACALVVVGGLSQMYVTLIASQALPLALFPGYEVHSSFGDGQVASYQSNSLEWMLGLGGVAVAALITLVGLRLFTLLPTRLDRLPGEATESATAGAPSA